MTAVFLTMSIAAIFVAIVLCESPNGARAHLRTAYGLLGWLTSGNWPAKLGGALLIMGLGALGRYALLHVHAPPATKLAGGIVASGILLFAAHSPRIRRNRREVALALAGSGFGAAYLTAYGAYAFFHYLASVPSLACLAFVAIGAGMYAMRERTASIAILALFGAYLAPAFALEQAGPAIVYGYYLAISQLTLAMVAMRGWRPLIHLSFLFTLAGGVFFAWTQAYYSPIHFAVMQPLLLALTATHVAMPLVERRSGQTRWSLRFDYAYFAVLPITAATLLCFIAPTPIAQSHAFLYLAAIWFAAALLIKVFAQVGAPRHALTGAILIALALYVRAPDLPWMLIGLGVSVSFVLAARLRDWPRARIDFAMSSALAFGILFFADSLPRTVHGLPFVNTLVGERLVAALLLIAAGRMNRMLRQPLAQFCTALGALALIDTVIVELYRVQIATLPLLAHFALVVATLGIVAAKRTVPSTTAIAIAFALTITAFWSRTDATNVIATILLAATPSALIALALRRTHDEINRSDRIVALVLVPIAACCWSIRLAETMAQSIPHLAQFALLPAVMSILLTLGVVARRIPKNDVAYQWLLSALHTWSWLIGGVLLFFSTLYIQRGTWPVLLDIVCVAALLALTHMERRVARSTDGALTALKVASTIGAALAAQAMLLRVLGRNDLMTVADVFRLHWPAVISLFWSVLGATLTILAREVKSRSLWSSGALLLVACAVKLIVFDFGSLRELTNILAVIAAGGVFLLVSWLAPPPVKPSIEVPGTRQGADIDDERALSRR